MTPFKKILLFIHRWLGFISGLVVFIVSISGCIFCFQDEIQDALYNYRKVQPQPVPYIKPSALKAITLHKYPKASINYLYYYGKDRPAAAIANLDKQGLLYIYLNPYTGKILHEENPQSNFFIVVEYIHLYLLLPPKIGGMVVGISVLVFIVMMISGIILWWPKRKSDRKRSLTIKWGARWRRVNYDLHNVLGFYATAVALVLAITGLSIAFDWVRTGIYNTANLGKIYAIEKTYPKSDTLAKALSKQPVIDHAFLTAQKRSSNAQMYLIYDPSEKAGAIGITAYTHSLHFYGSDGYTFDKYTGNLLQYLPHQNKSAGLKMNEMNYDIHVGQILGLTGKIIAFIASLICASLPVTGFIIWLGKRNKPKNKKNKSQTGCLIALQN
jgi:uncharacterized iron-regulated membrane protein